MNIFTSFNNKFFSHYKEADVFTVASAKFLFIISMVFFTVMFFLFFATVGKAGILKALLSSGTSCLTATITMFLVARGKVWAAGTFMSIIQALVVLAAGLPRSAEMSLVTSSFFCFPAVILAVIYTKPKVHITIMLFLLGLMILNIFRFNAPNNICGHEELASMFTRGSITAILNFVMIYILAAITMRSLRIALDISRDETKRSEEKNTYITRIISTIKDSYQELTDSINQTDSAVQKIFNNMQTEAATIEQLVASIEEISSTTTGIEETTKEQSTSVDALSASIDSLSSLIDSLQLLGNELQSEFVIITDTAESGNQSSKSLSDVNRKTIENSSNIKDIAGIIDEFFEKINLLSLNAAIEAARAGEHGRGFAVVADEVGKLADSSSSELKKINELLETNRRDVENSSVIITSIINFINSLNESLSTVKNKAEGTLKVISRQKELQGEMLQRTGKVRDNSDFIKNSSTEQTTAIKEIAASIENTNALVQDNMTNSQILRDNYEKLKFLAENLKNIISDNENPD